MQCETFMHVRMELKIKTVCDIKMNWFCEMERQGMSAWWKNEFPQFDEWDKKVSKIIESHKFYAADGKTPKKKAPQYQMKSHSAYLVAFSTELDSMLRCTFTHKIKSRFVLVNFKKLSIDKNPFSFVELTMSVRESGKHEFSMVTKKNC